MSEITTKEKPGARFKRQVHDAASKLLDEWVGKERAAEAKGRVAAAFTAAVMSAKKPDEFYDCTPSSVAHCVATAALTGIMPGTGATALAYLIPRRPRRKEPPQLTYNLSHRGLSALARRAGLVLVAIPVSHDDDLLVQLGEVVRLEQDPDNPPTTWDELRGVAIIVKEVATGITLHRGWVARKQIEQRRDNSDAYRFASKNEWAQNSDPWHVWPVEQSMKTAMHYAVARGWAVIDDTEAQRALASDADTNGSGVYNAETEQMEPAQEAPSAREALGLPNHGEEYVPDFAAENEKLAEREVIDAAPAEPEPAPAKKKAAPRPAPSEDDFFGGMPE